MTSWLSTSHYRQHHLRNLLKALILAISLLVACLFFSPSAAAYVNPASGLPRAGMILRPFDKPEHNWLPGHRGVDLPLDIGADVLSPADGVVAFAGMVVGTPTISITHPDGVRTTYQPVHTILTVGEVVAEKQIIGRLGHPTTPYPGLQWGAKIGEDYLNPIRLLPAPTIRLKPLTPAGAPA
ncbi:M23 family metallopeptidase [uncultured Corynebacterium sp.]|uniref:M23 family metallopeptidase n=1 Tax=uncultured Corynebacterium sp. TaxID=159447 RepID=UPI00342D8D8E